MGMELKKTRINPEELPGWVRDDLVIKMLDNCGLRVKIFYDQKYLKGMSDKPIIVIRRKKRKKITQLD
jgi:hypothetical protein